MKKSESIKNIASALIKFNSQMDKVAKTSENPFFKSKYAALPEILDAIKQPLIESGLVLTQLPDENGLTTLLMHESGEWIEATGIMHPVKSDPQSIGSAITYQRRYAIGAILNLNIDEDDDGNKASTPAKLTSSGNITATENMGTTTTAPEKPWLNITSPEFPACKAMIDKATDKPAALKALRATWAISKTVAEELAK